MYILQFLILSAIYNYSNCIQLVSDLKHKCIHSIIMSVTFSLPDFMYKMIKQKIDPVWFSLVNLTIYYVEWHMIGYIYLLIIN